MKICFITSLFGDQISTSCRIGSFKKNPKYDYIVYSNFKLNTQWSLRNVKENFFNDLSDNYKNVRLQEANKSICILNAKKSRFPKFLCWKILRKYDFIFHCDSWLSPIPDYDWENLARSISKSKAGFGLSPHRDSSVINGGINAEVKNIIRSGRESESTMETSINFLKNLNKNISFDFNQYFENTVIGYNPNNTTYKKLSSLFWKYYSNQYLSYRDQPLLNFLLLSEEINPFSTTALRANGDLFRKTGSGWRNFL
jgi:hypothetical protein